MTPFSPLSRRLFLLGFFVLIATNAGVIAHVAANRSGAPSALLTLSERELQLPFRLHKENSGLALRIQWRVPGKEDDGRYDRGNPAWLDAAKLQELGFTAAELFGGNGRKHFRQPLPKEVFIVLENDGESYREAVRRAEVRLAKEQAELQTNSGEKRLQTAVHEAEERLIRERTTASRLFAIDAGLDPRKLRATYSDRARFLITKAVIRGGYRSGKTAPEVTGQISKLSVETLHVPRDQRTSVDGLLAPNQSGRNGLQPPRYAAVVAYGRQFEPWIVSIHPLGRGPE